MGKEEISKLSVKSLKKMLAERGVECSGCTEKWEYVDRVIEVQGMPVKEANKAKEKRREPPSESKKKDDDGLEEVYIILVATLSIVFLYELTSFIPVRYWSL